MKKIVTLICICNILLATNAQTIEKEVLIIGTMHQVPPILKGSYKYLLKKGKAYAPEAIYVEFRRPDDTLSLTTYDRKFLYLSATAVPFLQDKPGITDSLAVKYLRDLTKEEYQYLSDYYLTERDQANYLYYKYLVTHGTSGKHKPFRNENNDLTFPLAIACNIRELNPVDVQHHPVEYNQHCQQCYSNCTPAEKKTYRKLNRKSFRRGILPGLTGRFGKYTNSQPELTRCHLINSMQFASLHHTNCQQASIYWDERNLAIATNLARQIRSSDKQRHLLIIGTGHIIGIKSALEKYFPDIRIKLLNNL